MPARASRKARGRAEETGVKEKRPAREGQKKIESRLEFLARMYAAKKDRQDEEEEEEKES